MKAQRGSAREVTCRASAEFKVLPAAYLGKAAKILEDDLCIAAAKEKRSAKVCKRKADTPDSRKGACNFKERQQGSGLPAPGTVKGEWFMTVRLAEHPHPGGAVEEGEADMRACEPIPTWIASGIDNAYLDKLIESRWATSVDPCGCRHLGYELVKRHENGRARESEVSGRRAVCDSFL